MRCAELWTSRVPRSVIVVPTAIFALSTIIIATADAEDYGGGSPGYNDGANHISTDGKTSARRRRRTTRLAGRSLRHHKYRPPIMHLDGAAIRVDDLRVASGERNHLVTGVGRGGTTNRRVTLATTHHDGPF